MKKGDYVFVYGTLRKGQRNSLEDMEGVVFVRDDNINGFLYDLGWFPGVKALDGRFDSDYPVIVGEVWQIEDESITNTLDVYEGHPNFFYRVQVLSESGLTVWVYTYPPDVDGSQLISSGDWTKREPQLCN